MHHHLVCAQRGSYDSVIQMLRLTLSLRNSVPSSGLSHEDRREQALTSQVLLCSCTPRVNGNAHLTPQITRERCCMYRSKFCSLHLMAENHSHGSWRDFPDLARHLVCFGKVQGWLDISRNMTTLMKQSSIVPACSMASCLGQSFHGASHISEFHHSY